MCMKHWELGMTAVQSAIAATAASCAGEAKYGDRMRVPDKFRKMPTESLRWHLSVCIILSLWPLMPCHCMRHTVTSWAAADQR